MSSSQHDLDMETRHHLLAVVDELSSMLKASNAAIEAQRCLPDEIADALASAGLYRMYTPRHLGGYEVDVATFLMVVERLAQSDASAAWCTFISCTSAIVAGYLPQAEARAIFSKPDLKLAGVFAPRGRATPAVRDGVEGYLVSGSWPWGSGSRNADYISGGCMVMDSAGKPTKLEGGAPNMRSMIFEAKQIRILDNWHVLGLSGSGSCEFEVSELFVPASRSVAIGSDVPLANPLYKFPVFGLLGIGIASVSLGIARRAIDSLIELANEKTPQGSSRPLAERASTQEHVARSEARLRSARAFLLNAIDAAWAASEQSDAISTELKRDIRLATTFATEESAAVVDRMHRLGGGSSAYLSSPLQRCLRDVHVATQHMMVSESTYELTGRLFLGLATNVSML